MISPQQREARRTMLGSSEAAAVMGLDPFASASDVWLVKTGQAEDFAGNDATSRGDWLEPALIQFALHKLNAVSSIPDKMFVDPTGLLCANIDTVLNPQEIIEAKSTVLEDGWGEPGTDQVPERVTIQCHHQFFVAGPEVRIAWVPMVIPAFRKFDFRLYRVDRDDALAEMVGKSGLDFMQNFVKSRIVPDDYKPSLEYLKRVKREPKKSVEIDPALVLDWTLAKQAKQIADATAREAKEFAENAQALILAAMGDAEGAFTAEGEKLTYFETRNNGYTVNPYTYRVLKIDGKKKQIAAKAAKEIA